jgi:guanylate kinase
MGGYEIDGESCWFVAHERMLDGLENNEFLDVGEHDNYLFGTTLESVRNVMSENKLCVLDVRPEVQIDGTEVFPNFWVQVVFYCGYGDYLTFPLI